MSFRFKQFSIQQDQCAMKVGTDGVLLGAWTPTKHNPQSVLDIGTGTGLIALMLAQRTNASQIDAIEIDEAAFEQAVANFEASPWGDRLYCFHAGLDELIEDPEDEYDLIVSNPPFFDNSYLSGNPQRDQARSRLSLEFGDLVEAADLLLSENGVLSVILPYTDSEEFIALAAASGLFPFKITNVRGQAGSKIKRSLMAFSRVERNPERGELIIELARHQYTDEYTELTKDFYLKL